MNSSCSCLLLNPHALSPSDAKMDLWLLRAQLMPLSPMFIFWGRESMLPLQFPRNKYSSRFTTISIAVAIVLLLFLASPTSSCTEQESNSLLQFLAGLSRDGNLSVSWKNSTDCCKWEGIACGPDKMVTDVFLASRRLEGFISPFLGNLTGLLHLNLSYNLLSGGLPQELVLSNSITVLDVSFNQLSGDLQDQPSATSVRPLQVLNISSNLFTGQFPSSTWEVMKNLVALNASNNSFIGLVPTVLCVSSPSFAMLDLSYNQFSGSIPPGLGNCSMMTSLYAGHNNFSGTIPDELFNITLLEHLCFANNQLEGSLSSISKLINLVTLDLGGNGFGGNIPDSIGELKRLEEIHLDYNHMSGDLPSTLSNCRNLITIDLKNNIFSGELTKVNFSNLPNLKILDLMENNFSGKIPETIYTCHKLTALRLSYNNFQGQLSKGLGNLKSLRFLSLAGNSFTNLAKALQILKSSKNLTTLLIGSNFMFETMPDDDTIDGFENLQVLSLRGCSLLGKIPYWLSKLTNLQMLFLNDNQLTGPIPDWINSLNYLFYLEMSNNNLTGEIPTALTEMSMLKSEKTVAPLDPRIFELSLYSDASHEYRKVNAFPKMLSLANNKFIGVIHPKIGLLKGLFSLNLSFNRLHGDIPLSICNLTNLLVLDLSSNHLTGAIPDALNNLHFLSQLNVSFNDLEGVVPTTGQLSTFTNSSFSGNPKLCRPVLNYRCSSAEESLVAIVYENHGGSKVMFAITFGLFFGVGVLYDQIVLSRYFG